MSLEEALLVTRARHGWWQDTVRLCDDGIREWRWRHDDPAVDDVVITARGPFEYFERAIVAMRATPGFDIGAGATVADLVGVAMRVLTPTGRIEIDDDGKLCNEHGVDYITKGALAHITCTDRSVIDKALRVAERGGAIVREELRQPRARTPWPGSTNHEKVGWIPTTIARARTEWETTPLETLAERGAERIETAFNQHRADTPHLPRRWPVDTGRTTLDRELHAANAAGLIVYAGTGWVPADQAETTAAAIAAADQAETDAATAAQTERRTAKARLDAWAEHHDAPSRSLSVPVPADLLATLLDAAGADS